MTTTLRVPRATTRSTGCFLAVALLAGGVAACGGGGSTTTTSPAAGPTGQPAVTGTADRQGFGGQGVGGGQGGPGGAGFRGIDPAQLQKIRECLAAAGIELPSPRAFPSGRPSGFPTDGSRPSGFPTDGSRPSGFPSAGARGGFGGILTSPQAKAALDACGIVLPTFSPHPRGAAPTASPTAG